MASATVARLLTAEEYEKLDEVLGFRDELIEGERILSPTVVLSHTVVSHQLAGILERQLPELSSELLQVLREAGWKFHSPASGVDSVPAPDLMVVRDEDAKRAIKSRCWFEGAPLLVIEVISPSERKARRLQKVGLYLDMGAPNVIEVDYGKRVVRVYTPEADSPIVYGSGDHIDTPFRASVDEIFSVLD